MMKVIERPRSTTIVDEAMFHLCRDEKEVRNAFLGVSPDEVVVWKKTVHSETFQPEVWIIVQKNGMPLSMCEKYICNYTVASEVLGL